jgi:hypothetical protein
MLGTSYRLRCSNGAGSANHLLSMHDPFQSQGKVRYGAKPVSEAAAALMMTTSRLRPVVG